MSNNKTKASGGFADKFNNLTDTKDRKSVV